MCSLIGRFWEFFHHEGLRKEIFCFSGCERWPLSSVSWSDYRELGEKQVEGSGAVHPRPPHEHPGGCGRRHCRPSGCQPVSRPPDQAGIIFLIVRFNLKFRLFY